MTWISSGLGWPCGVDPDTLAAWQNDREMCLAYAIHNKSLDTVSKRFKRDVSFMLEVLEHHPGLYREARGAAKADLWVKTTAVSGCSQVAKKYLRKLCNDGNVEELSEYSAFLSTQSVNFKVFHRLILGSMISTQSFEDTGTPLTMLNQGIETSIVYKKSIADYLDVPRGKRIQLLHDAATNVQEAILPL